MRWDDRPLGLNIRVTKAQRTRALRVMQTLIVALEQRGFAVTVTKDRKTHARVLGEPHEIRLTERDHNVPHVPTASEEEYRKKGQGWMMRKTDLIATGRLVLHIARAYWSRNTWIDGERRKVEDRLNEVVEALIAAALIDKQHREQREEQRRHWEEGERLRREEETRIKKLDDWMARWQRAEDIRRFVEAARQTLAHQDDADRWLGWAEDYASRIDPLCGQPCYIRAPDSCKNCPRC